LTRTVISIEQSGLNPFAISAATPDYRANPHRVLRPEFRRDDAFTLPLSGSTAFKSFPAISTDQATARAELRIRPSDSFPNSSPEIPQGEVVPMSEWSFANCPVGPPGTPSVTDICVAGGFQNNKIYELR
jgi:hypothetical protein